MYTPFLYEEKGHHKIIRLDPLLHPDNPLLLLHLKNYYYKREERY